MGEKKRAARALKYLFDARGPKITEVAVTKVPVRFPKGLKKRSHGNQSTS